jgi:hypothetical protein
MGEVTQLTGEGSQRDALCATLRRLTAVKRPRLDWPSMAQLLNLGGMAVGAVGIFLGFYFLSSAPLLALALVTGTCVGVVGILAFLRHVVFHRADAARMGWQTERPDWQFEVGFANLAFGLPGLIVALWLPSYPAFFVLLLGYALYLAQAAVLHLYRYLTDAKRDSARLWRSVIGTALFAILMLAFAWRALLGP